MSLIIVILIPIFFIIAFSMRMYGTPHQNIILENTLSSENIKDPEVSKIGNSYKNSLLFIATILSLCLLPFLFIPYDSLLLLSFFSFLLLGMFLFYTRLILAINKMHRLILDRNWQLQVDSIKIDTQSILSKNKRMASPLWLVLLGFSELLIFKFSFALLGQNFFTLFIAGLTVCLWLLFAFSYYSIKRIPVRGFSKNSAVNTYWSSLTKHYWSSSLLISSFLLCPLSFLPLLMSLHSYTWILLLLLIYLVLLCTGILYSLVMLLRLRKQQDQLFRNEITHYYYGEDVYWRYGFYSNPKDSRLLIPNRLNTRLSLNFGRPLGKVIISAILILLISVMTFSTSLLFYYDFQEDSLTLEIDRNSLQLDGGPGYHSEIPLNTIEKVELVHSLPDHLLKTNGLSTNHYQVGEFIANNTSLSLYAYTHSKSYIKITTLDHTYYYGTQNNDTTKKNFNRLTHYVKDNSN